jgi:hypothetical protein
MQLALPAGAWRPVPIGAVELSTHPGGGFASSRLVERVGPAAEYNDPPQPVETLETHDQFAIYA